MLNKKPDGEVCGGLDLKKAMSCAAGGRGGGGEPLENGKPEAGEAWAQERGRRGEVTSSIPVWGRDQARPGKVQKKRRSAKVYPRKREKNRSCSKGREMFLPAKRVGAIQARWKGKAENGAVSKNLYKRFLVSTKRIPDKEKVGKRKFFPWTEPVLRVVWGREDPERRSPVV